MGGNHGCRDACYRFGWVFILLEWEVNAKNRKNKEWRQ
jgi:hypothetical protein